MYAGDCVCVVVCVVYAVVYVVHGGGGVSVGIALNGNGAIGWGMGRGNVLALRSLLWGMGCGNMPTVRGVISLICFGGVCMARCSLLRNVLNFGAASQRLVTFSSALLNY